MTGRNRPQHLLIATLFATAVVACDTSTPVEPATAGAPQFAAADRYSEPFSFVMPAGTCGLTTTVRGEGVYEFVESFHPASNNGVSTLRAHGAAAGDDGSRYRFTYVNNWRFSDLPPRPWSAHMVDVFRLVGQGSAPDILVVFRADAHAEPGQPVAWDVVVEHGGLDCDPI